jgi:hypothetical protein
MAKSKVSAPWSTTAATVRIWPKFSERWLRDSAGTRQAEVVPSFPGSRRSRRAALLALVAIALAGTAALVAAVASDDAPFPRSTQSDPASAAARGELRLLAERMEELHYDLFHDMTREEWAAAVDDLDARIGELSDEEVLAELMRLVVLPSARGRDGHTHAMPPDDSAPPVYPLRFYLFEDGLFVVDALSPHQDLVGKRVTAIAGTPTEDVIETVSPLAPRDSEATVPLWIPRLLIMPSLLDGLGLLEADEPTTFTLTGADGGEETVEVGTVPMSEWAAFAEHAGFAPPAREGALWLSRMHEEFWWSYLPASRTVFVQYNQTFGPAGDQVDELVRRASRPDVERVVIDLRHNGGGNNQTYAEFLAALQEPPFDRPGFLYLIVGRMTFSAAGNFATEVDLTTDATFVGEPMGGGLNQFGDTQTIVLDGLGIPLEVHVATVYVEKAPGDERLTIEPEIPAPLTSAAYFGDRDPALRAILRSSRGVR